MMVATPDAKIAVVKEVAYRALPKKVKSFLPYSVFKLIVEQTYEEVKQLIEKLHGDENVLLNK